MKDHKRTRPGGTLKRLPAKVHRRSRPRRRIVSPALYRVGEFVATFDDDAAPRLRALFTPGRFTVEFVVVGLREEEKR